VDEFACYGNNEKKNKFLSQNSNLRASFDFFQAWYNFIKPHKSLRLEIDSGIRKWFQRTPAMAEGITDHMWNLKELLTFRVPVQ